MSRLAAPHPSRMSWEEFLEWTDADTFAEWVDGRVELLTSPTVRHQTLLIFLSALVQTFVEERSGGTVLTAPFLMRLDRSGRMPDLLFIAADHLDRLTDAYLDGPADLAVEIVSPGSRTLDRRDKRREYEEAGIREYWLLDPEREQAEFYGLDEHGEYQLLPVNDGRFESRVLSGLWIRVEWLWQEPLPPLMSVLREWGLV